ncbi:MAG TPA: hypothetical protein VFB66_07620 [Tepidisphaeraceae bacterium]|nr:hypothetical protein [Tepidisphaeraceae bacterium]
MSESVVLDRANDSVWFWVKLDGPPDFTTTDEFGRRADSFQYELDLDWAGGPGSFAFEDVDAVVRGDEFDLDGDGMLPIRAAGPGVEPDGDPRSGGWGGVLTSVPLNVQGSELWFEAPLSALGDHDGHFAYRVYTTEFGGTTSVVESTSIPLPAAVWPGLAAFGCGAVIFVTNRVRKRLRRA